MGEKLWDDAQSGFREGRGTMDGVFVLRRIFERSGRALQPLRRPPESLRLCRQALALACAGDQTRGAGECCGSAEAAARGDGLPDLISRSTRPQVSYGYRSPPEQRGGPEPVERVLSLLYRRLEEKVFGKIRR